MKDHPIIAPSVLAADFLHLGDAVNMLNQSEADWIHIDVMDGCFVPNISFGFPVCKAIQKISKKPLDVHLMIVQPERYLEQFREVGADHITVHFEACTHLNRTIHQIKDLGCKAGVAINPHTPIHLLENIINDIDLICLMSVNPGFGGQSFIPESLNKIRRLKQLILDKNNQVLIEVDGGVNMDNAPQLIEAGADILVAGSFIFQHETPREIIRQLKQL